MDRKAATETVRQTGKHLARQMSDKPRGEKKCIYTLSECCVFTGVFPIYGYLSFFPKKFMVLSANRLILVKHLF